MPKFKIISIGSLLFVPLHPTFDVRCRFLDLLAAEQETEQNLIRTRLANWPQDKLKRDGYCLTGLSTFWLQSNQFGKPVAAFLLGPGIALPYHRFE